MRIYLYNEQVFPIWRHLLLLDHLSEAYKIFWIVSDKWYFAFLVANSFKVHYLHFGLHLGDSYLKQRQ